MSDLSRLEFVALGLLHAAHPFTQEDFGHLHRCSVNVYETEDENTRELVAYVKVYFTGWSYLEHEPSTLPADQTSAELAFSFEQDENGRLTGKVRGGFYADKDFVNCELQYIKGW